MKYRMLEKGEKVKKGQIIRIAKASKTTYWYAELIGERFKVTRSKGKDIYVSYRGLLYNFLVFPRDIQVKAKRKKAVGSNEIFNSSLVPTTPNLSDLKASILEELEYRVKEEENRMDCLNFEEHEILGLLSKHTARCIWLHGLIDQVKEL